MPDKPRDKTLDKIMDTRAGVLSFGSMTLLVGGVVVAAWGVHGTHRGRHNVVRAMLPALHYLRLTKDGHPARCPEGLACQGA